MTEIILFHHALGLTTGVLEFADVLRKDGHTVHTPDLYNGHTYTDLDEGIAYNERHTHEEFMARAGVALEDLPNGVVYAGMSFGVAYAAGFAMSRPGALGALFLYGAADPAWFGGGWPGGVPVAVHSSAEDPWLEREALDNLVAASGAEFFEYPGSAHLFGDTASPDYRSESAHLMRSRVKEWLEQF